jgi:DNA-binding beta-propeller fold protein YncE
MHRRGLDAMSRRADMGRVALATMVAMVVCLGAAAAAHAKGALTFEGCFGNASGCAAVSGTPLAGAESVAASANGKSVYVAASGTGDDGDSGALSHFFVGADGELSYDGCLSDDGSGGKCTDVPGDGSQFVDPQGIAVSPNSASVYTANGGGTVAHLFAGNPTGTVSWDGCVSDTGSGGLCLKQPETADVLHAPEKIAVSPNGASVYVTSIHLGQAGYLVHLFANPQQGQLSWDGCVSNGGSGGNCADAPGLNTLNNLNSGGVAVAPNDQTVYGVSPSGAVSYFAVNPAGGQVTWKGCISDDGSGGTCSDLPGTGTPLTGASGVVVSPDGQSLYVVSHQSDSITAFSLDAQGRPTFQQCLSDEPTTGCTDPAGDSLMGASGVAVSPDGSTVYVTGDDDGTIAEFARDQSSGIGGGGTGGGGGGGGGTAPTPRTITAPAGNQQISLTISPGSGCVANTARLSATLDLTAVPGSKAKHLKFAQASFYVDRGVRHVRHLVRHRHGKRIVIKKVSYTANRTVHKVPVTAALKLAGLKSGSHTLKVKVVLRRTVHRHGHRVKVSITKTLKTRFSVC